MGSIDRQGTPLKRYTAKQWQPDLFVANEWDLSTPVPNDTWITVLSGNSVLDAGDVVQIHTDESGNQIILNSENNPALLVELVEYCRKFKEKVYVVTEKATEE